MLRFEIPRNRAASSVFSRPVSVCVGEYIFRVVKNEGCFHTCSGWFYGISGIPRPLGCDLLAVDAQGFQDLIDLKSDAGFAPSMVGNFPALG